MENDEKDLDALIDLDGRAPAETEELTVLADLVESYENKHFPIPAPTPIEAIRFRMEQLGLESRDLAPHTWRTSLMNQSLYPYRILVLWEPDGRWLIKVQTAASIGQTTLYDSRTVLLYKDLYDINVYARRKDISIRLGGYMATFPSVEKHGILVANLDMLLCQQIDLFRNKGRAGIERNAEVLRVLWTSSRKQGIVRRLFRGDIVDKFVTAIGTTGVTSATSATSGGKRRTKTRRATKKRKRRT